MNADDFIENIWKLSLHEKRLVLQVLEMTCKCTPIEKCDEHQYDVEEEE